MIKPLLFLLAPLAAAVRRQLQPGGSCSGTLGQAASTGCSTATGSACSKTSPGSTAYASWSGVTYSTSTGKFSGSLVHNGCPHDTRAWSQSSVSIPWKTSATALGAPGTATCCSTSFPATGYSSTPKTVPAGGIAGISMYGEDVYGFGDNGFNSATQNLCTTGTGGCPKNSDVDTCQAFGEATCGTSNLQVSWFLSDCGGHAFPWHYHTSLTCALAAGTTWASQSASVGHSTLAAVMLDGRGLYGPFESTSTLPTDLDACNGHTGPTPAYTANGLTVAASTSVYHYHVTSYAPFTVGCFGPVASIAAAKALYPACTAGSVCSAADQLAGGCTLGQTWTACTSKGQITGYTLGCAVFQGWNNATNTMETNDVMFPVESSACPACTGACAVGGYSPTPTPTRNASPSPSQVAAGASPSPSPSPSPAAAGASPSPSRTRSVLPSPSCSASGNTSPLPSPSLTPSPSQTGVSPSRAASASPSRSPSKSGVSPSRAASASPSPSPSCSGASGCGSVSPSPRASQSLGASLRLAISVPFSPAPPSIYLAASVIASVQAAFATALGVPQSWVSVTSRRRLAERLGGGGARAAAGARALQTTTVVWNVFVTPSAGASTAQTTALATNLAAVSAAGPAALATNLAPAFAAMSVAAGLPSTTPGYGVTSLVVSSSGLPAAEQSPAAAAASGVNVGAAVGGAVGGVVVVAAAAAAAVLIMRRRSRRQTAAAAITASSQSELQNKVSMHQNNLAAAASRANALPARARQDEDPTLA